MKCQNAFSPRDPYNYIPRTSKNLKEIVINNDRKIQHKLNSKLATTCHNSNTGTFNFPRNLCSIATSTPRNYRIPLLVFVAKIIKNDCIIDTYAEERERELSKIFLEVVHHFPELGNLLVWHGAFLSRNTERLSQFSHYFLSRISTNCMNFSAAFM